MSQAQESKRVKRPQPAAAPAVTAAREGRVQPVRATRAAAAAGEQRKRRRTKDEEPDEPEDEVEAEERQRRADVANAEETLRKYWDRSFEEDTTIDRVLRGEEENMAKRRQIPYLAELTGVDLAAAERPDVRRTVWKYKLKNPLVEAYVNIGRSHDHYIYPLHIDLAGAVKANIISRLHVSLRFDLDSSTWVVQVFGRNGVDIPGQGWVQPSDKDDRQDEVWRTLRAYGSYRFTVGDVQFTIHRNPVFLHDVQMAEYCRSLEGRLAEEEAPPSRGLASERVLIDCCVESAEEEEDDNHDHEINLDLCRTKLPSVPARGTTGQPNPLVSVIEDPDDFSVLNLLARYPLPPSTTDSSVGDAGSAGAKKARMKETPSSSSKSAVVVKEEEEPEEEDSEEVEDEDDDDYVDDENYDAGLDDDSGVRRRASQKQ